MENVPLSVDVHCYKQDACSFFCLSFFEVSVLVPNGLKMNNINITLKKKKNHIPGMFYTTSNLNCFTVEIFQVALLFHCKSYSFHA